MNNNNVSFGKGDDENQYMRLSQVLIDNFKRKFNDGGLCGSAFSVLDDNSEGDDYDSENGVEEDDGMKTMKTMKRMRRSI